jgi:hypothetical protein
VGPPEIYPDPDVLVIGNSFKQYLVGLDAIHRSGCDAGLIWRIGVRAPEY